MLKQTSQSVRFLAFFTASKTGKTGLAPTVDVFRDGTQIKTAEAATATGGGLYSYTLPGADSATTGSYVAIFKTSDSTVDLQHIPSFFSVGENWVQRVDENTSAAKTLTATERTAIRDAGFLTGDAFARIGNNGAALTALGDARLANLDAAVSSRSSYAGGDSAGVTSLLSRLTATRAGLLDNLDAAISTRLAAANYTAPSNADIATLLARVTSTRAALLDNLAQLDVAVSSRLASAGYTAPANAGIAAIETQTDKLGALIEADGGGFRFTTNALENAPTGSGGGSATAVQIREELDNNSTKLAAIDSGVNTLTTRLSAARAGNLDNLDFPVSNIPDENEVADAVRVELTNELTAIGAIETQTDKLGALIEADGAEFRFTENALEMSPAGDGSGSGGADGAPRLAEIRGEVDDALAEAGVTAARMQNLNAPVSGVAENVAEELRGDVVPTVVL